MASQLDEFAELARASDPARAVFEATPGFAAQIRDELNDTLQVGRAAELLPWPDLTRARLVVLRFDPIASWLPDKEGLALRQTFEAEMTRLYDAEDRRVELG